ncbi:hypothetical protein [Tateyamaria sp.]|uniref:hypothetical protein n=1 Tax=Tateyamaria sp. TaxID=1929288 RepID=UPI003B225E0B
MKARQQSCYELGRMLEAGMITPINGLGDANDLYARACTHKNTTACEKIGK